MLSPVGQSVCSTQKGKGVCDTMLKRAFGKSCAHAEAVYCAFQIDPNSIAAKDGRIREGDRIIQVGALSTDARLQQRREFQK